MILREAFATSLLVSMAPLLRGEIMLQLVQRFQGTNHIDFIHQPRPEERAPEPLSKDARVSKDDHRRDGACGHPSRRPRQERGLLRMRSDGWISTVRCDWFHGIDRLVASAFRIGVLN